MLPISRIEQNLQSPRFGIITALPIEYAAVKLMLENCLDYRFPGRGIGHNYLLGQIPSKYDGMHSVVLALADKGINSAGARVTQLLEHFDSIESVIMVGIAGGIPSPNNPEDHVRLGDIVVSDHIGVIQYDFVKETITEFINRAPPRSPSAELLESVRLLEVAEFEGNKPWIYIINNVIERRRIQRPANKFDILADSIDPNKKIHHPKDTKRVRGQPRVFSGPIASANTLLRNPVKRDELRAKYGARAVEMEGSGVADATWNHARGYLVVRGICDYCDANKNDIWHEYASIVAAAYAKALIESIPSHSSQITKTQVTIILEGEYQNYSREQEASLIFILSKILICQKEDIRVLQVSSGSIRLRVEMPTSAANLLTNLFTSNKAELTRIGIKRIILGSETEDSRSPIVPAKEILENFSNFQGIIIGKRYQIVEKLGRGHSGTVYKAYDPHLNSYVAIKIFNKMDEEESKENKKKLRQFMKEAQTLIKLNNHPNIAKIIDSGKSGEDIYIVMQYLSGGTLEALMGKPIQYVDAARILIQIGKALAYAHKEGLIHRDVKPSNILFTDSGYPILSDFGSVKSLQSDGLTSTGDGVFIGTLSYASPEQMEGNVSYASDIYALGLIFYEMITGRPPFGMKLSKKLIDPYPEKPSSYVPSLPANVDQVILRATARDLNERYSNMDSFIKDLEKLAALTFPTANSLMDVVYDSSFTPLDENADPLDKKLNPPKHEKLSSIIIKFEKEISSLIEQKDIQSAQRLIKVLERFGIDGQQAAANLLNQIESL